VLQSPCTMVDDRTYPNVLQALLSDILAILPGVAVHVTDHGKTWWAEASHGKHTVAIEVFPHGTPTYGYSVVNSETVAGVGHSYGSDTTLSVVCDIGDLLEVRGDLLTLLNRVPEAQRAYERYGEFVGWKNYAGLRMPSWDEVPSKIKLAWCYSLGWD